MYQVLVCGGKNVNKAQSRDSQFSEEDRHGAYS